MQRGMTIYHLHALAIPCVHVHVSILNSQGTSALLQYPIYLYPDEALYFELRPKVQYIQTSLHLSSQLLPSKGRLWAAK